MKKLLLYSAMAFFLLGAMLFSCSNNQEAEEEKGAIDEMTDKAAKEMTDRITVPLERARQAREAVDEKYSDMEENLREEEKE
jgi:hypothetical protein